MIRTMKLEDIPSVYAIDRLDLKSNWKENTYRFELLDLNTRAYVYVIDEKVIGFVISKAIGRAADLLQIAVHPDYRRQKVGIKLMEYTLKELKDEGVLEMFLEVYVKNTGVIGFYRKLDFKTINIRKNYYGRGKDAISMKLKVR